MEVESSSNFLIIIDLLHGHCDRSRMEKQSQKIVTTLNSNILELRKSLNSYVMII